MIHAKDLHVSLIASLPDDERAEILASLTAEESEALLYDWPFWARPKQLAPAGDWQTWLIMAGRGFGKSRTGAEWVRDQVRLGARRISLVGRTASDVRDVMVEGQSGIMACSPANNRPVYEPSKRRLTWPNGAIATTYTADTPDQLRGPNHDKAWCDEIAAWRFANESWDQLMLGLRLGDTPQVVVTTTPRPIKLIKGLVAAKTTALTVGSSYENRENLAEAFFTHIIKQYEGTRLGRQELNAELLEDVEGALWQLSAIDATRVSTRPAMRRIVIAVDPPGVTAECGIAVCGEGMDGQGYFLEDRSAAGTPAEWSAAVVAAYFEWQADCIVAEANQGGAMVEYTIRTVRDANGHPIGEALPIKLVWASRGKQTRAEPISALYEQGRIHHVGAWPELETQMCEWVQGDPSPDRMDAMVWGFTELFIGEEEPQSGIVVYDDPVAISRY